ncbi:short chain dehydrogenase [Stieleria maiorica]|uniref:Short chain dehydrogenase n=1 Tax=Stieleria maiorica TaxID=2795974 RepID=A0A5B9MH24_9BACT|nr:SDR family oxidoreductase [Stieleria maiorica]QEF98924.1 short chain dehydrogenase [Stieleria maiorica]
MAQSIESSVNEAMAQIRETASEADLLGLISDNSTADGIDKTIQAHPDVDILVNNSELFPGQDWAEAEKRFMAENRSLSLIQRLIEPEEIANLVAFVASPLAAAINGAALRTEGGIVPTIA